MTAVFADTFYGVALTDPDDALYEQAARAESALIDTPIVTTDEVVTEFLTFFSNSLRLRRRPVETVRELTRDANVRIFPKAAKASKPGSIFMPRVPTRAIVSPIAARCRPCAAKV